MMTITVFTNTDGACPYSSVFLLSVSPIVGAGLQVLLMQSPRGELTETTLHTQEAIVNKQSPVNSNALHFDRYHGAIKTGKI